MLEIKFDSSRENLLKFGLIFLISFVAAVSMNMSTQTLKDLPANKVPDDSLIGGEIPKAEYGDSEIAEELDKEPPVVFIILESTNARHIGPCYGYRRSTAPNICGIAEDGVLFRNAYSQATQTSASVPSMMTGKPPSILKTNWNSNLSDKELQFTEVLVERGYSVRGDQRRRLIDLGFLQGIKNLEGGIERLLPESGEKAMSWHFVFEPHSPYTPEEKFRIWDNISASSEELETYEDDFQEWASFTQKTSRNELIGLYNGEILAADNKVGRIRSTLEKRGIYKDSMIVIVSDHGEVFEQNLNGLKGFHGGKPYDKAIKVPLIVKFPDNRYAGTVVDQNVRLMDIGPTILDYLGVADRLGIGKSLMPTVKGEELRLPIFATSKNPKYEAVYGFKNFRLMVERGLRCTTGKTLSGSNIYYVPEGENQTDPGISVSEFARMSITGPTFSQLENGLCSFYNLEQKNSSAEDELSGEVRERLKNLGYLE